MFDYCQSVERGRSVGTAKDVRDCVITILLFRSTRHTFMGLNLWLLFDKLDIAEQIPTLKEDVNTIISAIVDSSNTDLNSAWMAMGLRSVFDESTIACFQPHPLFEELVHQPTMPPFTLLSSVDSNKLTPSSLHPTLFFPSNPLHHPLTTVIIIQKLASL